MNKVISGYFDDAHRGLQRQQQSPHGGLSTSSSNVQLPPLRPDSGPPFPGAEKDSWDKRHLQQSNSMGSLDLSHEQVARGMQAERHQQVLQDNSKLSRKVRALQDQLAITSAKKEAFKAQAQRLEKEFRKGREQSDTLQKEVLEAKREASSLTKEAQEAVQMMTEMRKAHIQEVRLLQRGLAARGGDSRNKVNEVADLVDKLGRAVVGRDEAIRDKTKLQAQFNKAVTELRAVTDDCGKLKRQNRSLHESLKEAQRKAKFVPPRTEGGPPDDSDEEFEQELSIFEKRFQILEEGPAGLDILASNLSKDKQTLEKRLKASQETVKTVTASCEKWKKLCVEKDNQITDLNEALERAMREQAKVNEQIAEKRREIELQVAQEKSELEQRINELELECDNARTVADGMEKASSRLTRELVKVHEQYSRPAGAEGGDGGGGEEAAAAAPAAPAEEAAPPSPAAVAAEGGAEVAAAAAESQAEPAGPELLASAEQKAKTGEVLKLEVYRGKEATELRAKEVPDGEECCVPLSAELLGELDQEDPWAELFSRVGVDPGPPRRIAVSSLLGRREVTLQPAGSPVILAAYRYGARRFFLSGVELSSQRVLDLAVLEDSVSPEVESQIDACEGDAALFGLLAGELSLKEEADGAVLVFGGMR